MVMLNDGGDWLKIGDVKNGDKIKFKDEGGWQENTRYTYPDGNPKMDFVIKVEHNGKEKSMRLNMTNRAAIISAYGKDTLNWIGKTAIISKVNALVAGKMREIISLIVEIESQGEAPEDVDVPF